MTRTRIIARPSDGRIELTSIVKEHTNADKNAYYTNKSNNRIAIYRNKKTGFVNADSAVKPNIEGRYFFTPTKRKSYYTVSIGRNYIHVS